MNIFLLFLSMFFMIGYYLIASPSQNLGYNDVQYDQHNSEMRSLIDCVVAKQNAFINNSSFDDDCVKRYKINSTEICTDEQFELADCAEEPYYDFIITTSYKIEEYQYKDAFNVIDKTHQDFGTLGLFMAPYVIAANSIGKKLLPDPVIKNAGLESGQIAYVIQNSIQTFDPNHPNPGDNETCRFSIIGKICDDAQVEICTGNEVWDEELQKCVDHTGLCEDGKLLLIDESDNSYYCIDPTSKTCTGNERLQYNPKLQAWECVVVENSDDSECDLAQFSLRLHSVLDSAAPTVRIRTINCNSCEKRVLDESTCTIYCSPDATKLTLGECYNDKLVPLNKCTGPNRGVYFGFAPGRTQYSVNISPEDDSFQNSDIILNVEKFLDEDHLQDRLYHCFECAEGMSERLSVSPFSAMCKEPGEENDENIVCDGKQIVVLDPETGKYYCKEIEDDDDDDDDDEEYHGSGIALSSYSGTTTYPNPVVFYVTENSTNGTLTVKTSDPKIATASISGSIVTVTPVARGKAYIYVRSSTRGSYEAGVARYTLHVNSASIVVSAPDITFNYDGNEHNCANVSVRTPSTGAVVSYGATAGSYRGAPTITNPGSTTVYYLVTATNYEDLTGHYQCSVSGGQYGGVELSTYSSTITYPQTSTYFTASCLSRGKFTVDNSDPDIAAVEVGEEGKIWITYKTPGTTVITITCPEGRGYLESSAAYILTTQQGTINATASNKTLTYNGVSQSCHNVFVTSPREAVTTYSTSSDGIYSLRAPTLKDPGSIMVYYKVNADNYNEKSGSYKCTMSKGGSSTITLSEYSGTITYPEKTTSFTATCNSDGNLKVTSDDTKVATATISGKKVTVTYQSAGETTIHVICEKTSNYEESEATYNITTKQGTLNPEVDDKQLTYSGSAQSCANTFKIEDVSSFDVKYSLTKGGTYSSTAPTLKDLGSIDVFYKINAEDYDEYSGSYKCIMSSGTSSLELSSYSGSVPFPEEKIISVTKNVSNGTLNAKSDTPSVATVTVSGTNIIMTPVKTGTATITVTSAATGNYSASSVDYNLTVTKGEITATITNPTQVYDGSSLSCNGVSNTKPSTATVKYRTSKEDPYLTTVPTVTNVSDTKTIYYQITAANYNEKEGSFSCSITSGGEAVITLSETRGTIVYPTKTRKFTASCSSNGTLSVESASPSVAEASITGKEVTVSYKSAGEANIIVTCAATTNYGQASAVYKITNQLGTITADVENKSKIFDGNPLSCNGVSNVNPKTGTVVEYKKPGGSYSTNVPTITNASDSTTISYRITATNYTSKTGDFKCSIIKEEGDIIITPESGELTYPNTATFNAMCTTGGALSVTSEKPSIATATINQSTGNATVSYAGEGETRINVKCAATGNADEIQGFYTIQTHPGVISATVKDKTKTYDGSALSCNGVIDFSPDTATVKYKKSGGSYSTSVPTITNVADSTTIYYQITADKYKTETGTFECSVTKKAGTVTISPTSGELTYPNTATFNVTCNTGGGTATVTPANSNIASATINTSTGVATVSYANQAGTTDINVKCAGTANYKEATGKYTIKTNAGTINASASDKTLTYTGSEQSCANVTVTSPSSGTSTTYSTSQNGTYTSDAPKLTSPGASTPVYYKVSKTGYTTATGHYTCTMSGGQTPKITLSESSGTIQYPTTSRTFTAECESGGALSVASANESYAKATISGKTVTVNYVAPGSTTIYVYCDPAGSFTSGSATYSVTTKLGKIEVTAKDKVLQYTGSEQSCANVTVTSPSSGTSTTYSTSQNGTYISDAPKLTSPGASTPVYYKVTKSNYETASGNYTCSVSGGGTGTITLNPSSIDPLYPYSNPVNIDVTCSSGGAVSAVSSNTNISSVDYKNTKVTVGYVNAGSATVTITCGEKNGYSAVSKTLNVTNKTGTILVNAPDVTVPWDEKERCSEIAVNRPTSGYTVQFSTSSTGTYTSEYKIEGTGKKTVYYSVSAPNYDTLYGSFNCTVQNGTIKADAFDVEYQYDGAEHSCGIVNVKKPASGATVKYSLDNSTFDKDSIDIVTPGSKKVYYQVTANFYNPAYGNYNCSVIPGDGITIESCQQNGGTVSDADSIRICVIPTNSSGKCPDGFTFVTVKQGNKTAYYCEQIIIEK